MKESQIKDSLRDLYNLYAQHKALFKFYQDNKTLKTKEEIENRVEYIKKNKIKQRSEIETLYWILGIVDGANEEK